MTNTFAGAAITNHDAAAELSQREADSQKAQVRIAQNRDELIHDTAMNIAYSLDVIFGDNIKMDAVAAIQRHLVALVHRYGNEVMMESFRYRDASEEERKNFVWKW